MDFGSATEEDKLKLTEKDFALPQREQHVLNNKPADDPKIYIGLPKWGRNEYIGTLYPARTKEKEFPDHYVQHFNSIEFNATHYKIYTKESIEKWAMKAGDRDFLFCLKIYQGITHRGSLKGKTYITGEFFNSISAFGKHLGPVFIQVSDKFSSNRKDELFEFLSSLPGGFEYFLEVRHPSWFENTKIFDQLVEQLKYLKIGFVITDTAMRRDAVHMVLTIPKVMIRFGWFGVEAIDKFRILQWKERLQLWFAEGLKEAFFFLHVSDESKTVEFARWVQGELCIK